MPAWFAVQVAILARAHGLPAPVSLQLEYSLVSRDIEREHVGAATELGMGIMPWSPLAGPGWTVCWWELVSRTPKQALRRLSTICRRKPGSGWTR
ncbi:MAG: aldo/keto reductase [Allobranchiibius sp.]